MCRMLVSHSGLTFHIFPFLICFHHRLLFSAGQPPKLHLHEFRLFVLLSYFKCLLYLPLRNFRGGSTVSRAGLLAATRVMVPTEMWPGEKTLFAAQPILYVYVTDGQNGAYFSAPLFDSIEINGHFRHLLSGGCCLKMYFLFSIRGIEELHVRVQRDLLVSLSSHYIKTRWMNLQTTVWFAAMNAHVKTEIGYVCFVLSTAEIITTCVTFMISDEHVCITNKT